MTAPTVGPIQQKLREFLTDGKLDARERQELTTEIFRHDRVQIDELPEGAEAERYVLHGDMLPHGQIRGDALIVKDGEVYFESFLSEGMYGFGDSYRLLYRVQD